MHAKVRDAIKDRPKIVTWDQSTDIGVLVYPQGLRSYSLCRLIPGHFCRWWWKCESDLGSVTLDTALGLSLELLK